MARRMLIAGRQATDCRRATTPRCDRGRESCKEMKKIQAHKPTPNCRRPPPPGPSLGFSTDGQRIVSAGRTTPCALGRRERQGVAPVRRPRHTVNRVAFFPDGKRIRLQQLGRRRRRWRAPREFLIQDGKEKLQRKDCKQGVLVYLNSPPNMRHQVTIGGILDGAPAIPMETMKSIQSLNLTGAASVFARMA